MKPLPHNKQAITPSWSGKGNTMRNQNGSLAMKITVLVAASLIIFAIVFGSWWVSVSNKEIGLRNAVAAQNDVIEAYFDKMWKIIKQQAGIAEKERDSFGKIYKDVVAGRYSGEGKGQMMLWIKEHNPEFKNDLFAKLMVSIEAQRDGFFVEQKKIIDMVKTHTDMIQMLFSSWVVGDRAIIEYEVISSAVSKEVMKTREENDVDLFNKKD
jgi:hypothetical protein